MLNTTSKDDELEKLLEEIELLAGSEFYDHDTKEAAKNLIKQYGIQERIEQATMAISAADNDTGAERRLINQLNVLRNGLTNLKDKQESE